MAVEVTETHTTTARATLSHDEIVKMLGLGVTVQAGLPATQPGQATSVDIRQVEGSAELVADVVVVVDHNYKPSEESADPTSQSAPGTGSAAPLGA